MIADLYYSTELHGKWTEQMVQIRGDNIHDIEIKAKAFQKNTGLSVVENEIYFMVPPFYNSNWRKDDIPY